MPGTVVSYDASAQTASISPDVGGGTRLDDVPVLFMGVKDGMLEFDLVKPVIGSGYSGPSMTSCSGRTTAISV